MITLTVEFFLCGKKCITNRIHLTVNEGTGNTVNLIWDNYEGANFAYNRILRDSLGDGNWQVLDSVASNVFTWVDIDPSPSLNSSYQIEIVFQNGCTAAKAINYNSSRSNKRGVTFPDEGASIVDFSQEILVYPNPTKGKVTIVYPEDISLVEVYDLRGKMVYSESNFIGNEIQLDLSEFEAGMYSFTLFTGEEIIQGKVVKD